MTRIDLTALRTLAEAERPRVRHGGVDAPSIHLPTTTVLCLLDALEAVLDRARMEQDDAEYAMTYAAEINDGLTLASQQARKQAWADAARAITTALEAS